MGNFSLIVDIVAMLNIFIFLFFDSLSLCFAFEIETSIYTPIYTSSLILFSIEFLLRFNIGYYHLGKAV